MTVKELILKLQVFEALNGNLEVFVYSGEYETEESVVGVEMAPSIEEEDYVIPAVCAIKT